MIKCIDKRWRNFISLIILLAVHIQFANAYGQNINVNKGKIDGRTYSWLVMESQQEKIKGILILMPGWGESIRSIFKKTTLPRLLAEKGYITIVPELRQTLFADDYTITQLNQIIKVASSKYNLNDPHIFLGGLSAGGSVAIVFAEHLVASDSTIKIRGVFAIDPPLDLERMYASAENKIKYKCGGLIQKEGFFIKSYLEKTLGGTPESKPEQYLKFSAHLESAKENTNAKWLKDIPIRLYTEPDLEFVRKKYCTELQPQDINAYDLERLNTFLSQSGNNKSQYITTEGKGFHSWNILDASECAEWIMKLGGSN